METPEKVGKVGDPTEETEALPGPQESLAPAAHNFRLWHLGSAHISDAGQFVPVPVLKVTAKRVYVPRDFRFRIHDTNDRIALDRAELEEKGRTSSGATRHNTVYTDAGRAAFEEWSEKRAREEAEAEAASKVELDRNHRAFLGLPQEWPLIEAEIEKRFARTARLMDLNPETLEDEYRTKFFLTEADRPAKELLRVRAHLLAAVCKAQP